MDSDQKEFQSDSKKDLPIFIKWMDFLKWLLVTLDGFPKKARFNFSDRLTNLALQIVEDLVEARYSKNKGPVLRRANMNLEKIRIIIRICFELRFLPRKSYEHASFLINEVGKMLGGWMKQQKEEYEKTR
jgi:hypothetical protein